MKLRSLLHAVSACMIAGGVLAGTLLIDAAPSAASPTTLTVGCGAGSSQTIGEALGMAAAGDTIQVCAGTYHPTDPIVIEASLTGLTLEGVGKVIIDAGAAGPYPGIQDLANGSTIDNLTVTHAFGEGILVGYAPGNFGSIVSNVHVLGNTVMLNDRGNPKSAVILDTSYPYPQCAATEQPAPAPPIPGDCGEGIHLLSVSGSSVTDNTVMNDSGGILLTDENGPTTDNTISHNYVANNSYDCGITMASHAPHTVETPGGTIVVGGIIGNTVSENTIVNNGTLGEGGGVLLASPVPGASLTGNTISDNTMFHNGLAGVTVHSHAGDQDFSGNSITGNTIGMNNLSPDSDYAYAGAVDPATTGIIVIAASSYINNAPAVTSISIEISNNAISHDVFGIWTAGVFGGTVDVTGSGNTYSHVRMSTSFGTYP